MHDVAEPPGRAACAANKQGKFSELKHLVWEEGFNQKDLSPTKMEELAGKAGLDLARFKADMEGADCRAWVQAGHDELGPVGTSGTPAFYINGRYLSGAQPVENFKKVIDEERKKADDAIRAGTKPEEYYAQVVAKGVKKLGEEPE